MPQKTRSPKSNGFHPLFFWLIIFSFLRLVSAQSEPQTNAEEIIKLESEKAFEREFAPGAEKHFYQIDLSAGQYLSVIVEQRGVDVTVNLLGIDGKSLMQFDNDYRPQGSETVELVAPTDGSFRLIVAPKYKNFAAGKYRIKINAARPSAEKEREQQKARDALAESTRFQQTRKYDEAIAAANRARVVLENSDDANSLFYGVILRRTGIIFFDQGNYAESENYLLRAAKVFENALDASDPRVSETLNTLAVLYNVTGKYDQSEAIFQRTLINQEKIFGENHPLVATALNNFGNLYRRRGNYAKAEMMHLRSLAIREKIYGPEQIEVNTALTGLATIYYEKKDFEKAKLIDERALKIGEKLLAPDDPKLMNYLNNVALAATELGDYGRAETLFTRALSIGEKAFGADSINITIELNNLGKLYAHQGDYVKSDSYYRRSLQIREKSLAPDHPFIASTLGNIAANYLFRGEYSKAEPLLISQLAIREKSLGGEHPDVAESLNRLARLYEAKGDAKQAVNYQTRANNLLERNIKLNLYAGSEKQQLAFFDYLAEQTDQLISMQTRFADNDSLELAATAVLQRKGRVQDILADGLSALRRRFSEKDRKILSDLSDVNSQLAQMVLDGAQKKDSPERSRQIETLTAQKENLEAEISRLSAGFYESGTASLTLKDLQTAIPSDAVLLEFAVYHPFKLQASKPSEQYGEARYAVYVIRANGKVNFRDLGAADAVNQAIRALREAMRDSRRKDAAELSRAVDAKILQPVRALLGDAKHLLISPDGELNLMPFEALIDENGKYLIENYPVTYLTGGRDLLRMKTKRASQSDFLIIANPQFGEPINIAAADAVKTPLRSKKRRTVDGARSFSDTYFAPLGGTAREARSIQTLFPDAQFLTEARATETALKQIAAPRILHIATHGFFLPNIADSRTNLTARQTAMLADTENPLLRSGLAMANANQRGSTGDDGILTALEASNLNLWGTKLVVLSACDTGLGQVRNGEGVYGLRRAFMLAGTESLVMSLWSVSDAATRELMTEYYKNLKQGAGRGASLRQVQLQMLKRKEREHPFYWAGFIQSGEWANLEGKR